MSVMLKIVLALVVTNYDIALKEPDKGRPKNFEFDLAIVPNLSAGVLKS